MAAHTVGAGSSQSISGKHGADRPRWDINALGICLLLHIASCATGKERSSTADWPVIANIAK